MFAGPEHTTILDEYTNLTGRPFVPPDWAFLNWRWRGELDPGVGELVDGVLVNADLADDINNFDTHAIPTGVYIFDRPALVGNFGFAQWEWDGARFPNLASMLASVSGGPSHRRWFLVNRAKASAPISWARKGAFSTPPAALTWAPKRFVLTCRPSREAETTRSW